MLKYVKYNFSINPVTEKLKQLKHFRFMFVNILDHILQFIFTDQA
jgi:hypothetical protein